MGHHKYRFSLIHDSGTFIISEPDGWRDIKITLERDLDYHGIFEFFETSMIFYGRNGRNDGGMDTIISLLSTFGPSVQIKFLCEINPNGDTTFETLFTGLLDGQSAVKTDNRRLQVPIIKDDFWATFKARESTNVNILSSVGLDDQAVTVVGNINAELTSQKINQNARFKLLEAYDYGLLYTSDNFGPDPFIEIDANQYVGVDIPDFTISEIKTKFDVDTSSIDFVPMAIYSMEYDGDYDIDIKLNFANKHYFAGDDIGYLLVGTTYASRKIEVYIQFNGEAAIKLNTTNMIGGAPFAEDVNYPNVGHPVQDYTIYDYVAVKTLSKGSTIKLYVKNVQTYFNYSNNTFAQGINQLVLFGEDNSKIEWSYPYANSLESPGSGGTLSTMPIAAPNNIDSHIYISAKTTYPQTTAEGFLLHDVAAQITERITGYPNSFYSEYLGSTMTKARVYPSDGCAWPHALFRGLQLRQYLLSEKAFSMSFKQWWEGANPILNLGLSYEITGGVPLIRVEEKAFFYNPTPILYFDFVNNIQESYDKDFIFDLIRVGYQTWQSEDISGLDDPQTKHQYALTFKTIGKELNIESAFIAASLAIETTRRTNRIKSADYKFDDNTFIIALNRDALSSPPNTFVPELDENFDSVTNLSNADTRYNIGLSPARNLIRWANLINGCLQFDKESKYKFTYGEGNYSMITDYKASSEGICMQIIADTISEKQDLILSGAAYGNDIGYLFQPIIYTFEFPLSYDNYRLLRDNKTQSIAVSTSDTNHEICFIKKLEYDINKSKGTFTLWKH